MSSGSTIQRRAAQARGSIPNKTKNKALTEKQILWEIAKADNEAKKREERYTESIDRLAYWVKVYKDLFPDRFQHMIDNDVNITAFLDSADTTQTK